MLKCLRDFSTSWFSSHTEVWPPGRHSHHLCHLYFTCHANCQGTRDSHFTDKAVHQKEKQRSTAWWVQAITSPSASTKGQNTRKESFERHKDSWFLFKVSISVDKHVSSSVIWAGNQGRGFSKKFYKTICSSEQRTLCPCLSAWRDLINLSITWNFCSGLIDGREYLPTTARVRM